MAHSFATEKDVAQEECDERKDWEKRNESGLEVDQFYFGIHVSIGTLASFELKLFPLQIRLHDDEGHQVEGVDEEVDFGFKGS